MLPIIQTLISVISMIKVSKDGRFYFVLNGKCKYLPKGTVNLITSEACNKASSHKEEEPMKLYHFMKIHPTFGEIRMITNNPTEEELISHTLSLATKRPVDDLFAINSGTWMPYMLIKRLSDKGIKFRLAIVKNGCINPGNHATPQKDWKRFHATWDHFVSRSNFAWANSWSSFFITFAGVKEWGLTPMGIELLDAPKASKRANEAVRSTEMYRYTEDIKTIKVKIRVPDTVKPVARDGMSYISVSFALSMVDCIPSDRRRKQLRYKIQTGKMRRVNFRLLFPEGWIAMMPNGGLIKGDAIIRPDRFMNGYDVITVPENLKDEIRATESFIMATAFEHHPVHEANWDIQRLIMNPQILTHEHRARDLKTLVAEAKKSIADGNIPEWLLRQGMEAHGEDNVVGSVRDTFSDFNSIAERWQAAGLDIRAAQNVVRMAYNGVISRMGKWFSSLNQGVANGYAKSMWLPKSNALTILINTHGSLVEVGNYRSKHTGEKAYFIDEFGIILPDQRMEDLYPLIGGGDLDDSVELQLVKLWSSDFHVTEMMRKNGVIGESEIIPTTKDNARFCASVLRSPNGAGEFSFLEIEDILDLPWQMLDLNNVEVVDLASLPLPQAEMLTRVQVGGIQSSLTYSRAPFTRDNAKRQIKAQQHNPGIGQAANAMMAWAGVAGPSMPPVIAAPFEQLVDGTQQLSDPAIFKAVKDSAALASSATVMLLQEGKRVDSYLVPRFAGREDKEMAREHSYHGPLSEFQESYRAAIKELHDEIMQKSLQMRQEQPLIEWVRELKFSAEAFMWGDEFLNRYEGKLNQVQRLYKMEEGNNYGIARLSLQAEKYEAIRNVVDEAIAELNSFERPGQRALALWFRIVRKTQRNPYGSGDRLLFQQGTESCIADLLIPVLIERGWGS